MFCKFCGSWLQKTYKFCPRCAKKVAEGDCDQSTKPDDRPCGTDGSHNDNVAMSTPVNNPKRPCSFADYYSKKSQERQSMSLRPKTKKSRKVEEEVTIITAMMVEKNSHVEIIRGTRLPLKVKKNSNSREIKEAAIQKRKAHDRSFRGDRLYTLNYPDGSEVINIPGTDEPFSLVKYKEELGKGYAQIRLYLCYQKFGPDDKETDSDDDETGDISTISKPQTIKETKSSDEKTKLCETDYTSIEIDESTQASTSNVLNAMGTPTQSDELCDLDEIYATLLFNEINSKVFDDDFMEDIAQTNVDDVIHEDIEENITLKEILSNLSEKTSYDKISIFNISRNHIWEGTKRAMNRKSFSPLNKLSVKFTDDIGQSEGAVDMGGPAREFFTLITDWLVNSRLFFGEMSSKFLSLNATCLEEREYFLAGQIFAMSLVHGGPGVNCLSSSCYDAIVNESGTLNLSATLDDIPDVEMRASLGKLLQAPCVEDAQKIIRDEKLDTIFDMAGTLQMIRSKADVDKIVQRTINWYVLGRSQPAYCSLKEGLRALGVLEAMLKYPHLFRETFCYKLESLTVGVVLSIFKVKRAEEGSNRRNAESLILSHWNDFLQDAEEDPTQISLSEILFFASGCKIIPPQGLQCELQFLHETEKDGKLSKFPKANTCACILYLPVVHGDYESFKDALVFGVKNTRGFGCA